LPGLGPLGGLFGPCGQIAVEPKALCAVVFGGPIAITFPVLVWVFLVY
jgi:hypothetical protein